ncbi:hypothetical protein ZPR_3716 [Zunongwangia profunda SM-A87]|uniref:Uncharacterized protein n=1 Tax=Zunongwangia profunda (strain DSM 18752 / CCTCC AB 206139 / SM-A87) TaxID=655815 RepID=D5BLA0_ZUNPS|nr:hypothetical protein ZPR_3716 [Zunongwangia profunda SM-A87]
MQYRLKQFKKLIRQSIDTYNNKRPHPGSSFKNT